MQKFDNLLVLWDFRYKDWQSVVKNAVLLQGEV